MKEIILNVEGMVCTGCEKRVENSLKEIKNVKEVNANHENNKVIIKMEDEANINEIKERICELGFEVKE
jgi:heavy metal transport/detoxification protein